MPAQEPANDWLQLLDQLSDAWPPVRWRDVGVVVGCSGGADSVGLLRALTELSESIGGQSSGDRPSRGFLIAAHFNHALRAEASGADEQFVRQLAAQLGVGLACGRATSDRRDEASMSRERIAFLTRVAKESGARYVALAHSSDDNVETVLHHLIRGTGPAGLAGIGPYRSLDADLVLVRPLLGVSRAWIRRGLAELDQAWREDASNENTDYRRNWIRHELIPLIQTQYPDAVAAIARAIEGQREWRSTIDSLARQWIDSHRQRASPLTIRRDPGSPAAVVVAAAQQLWDTAGWPRGEMTREHWLRLAHTLTSRVDQRYTLPSRIEVAATVNEVTLIRSCG